MKKILCILIFMIVLIVAKAEGGSFGDGLNWELQETTLTISGSGKMIYEEGVPPWYAYQNIITKINIDAQIDPIPEYAFAQHTALTEITLPKYLLRIEKHAFQDCASLLKIEIPGYVFLIGDDAFDGCMALTEIRFLGDTKIDGSLGTCPNAVLKGYDDTTIHDYAMEEGLPWVSLGEYPISKIRRLSPSDSIQECIEDDKTDVKIILEDGCYIIPSILDFSCGSHLTIQAEHPGKVEILADYSDAPVVYLQQVSYIRLCGLILGHKSSSTADTVWSCGGGYRAAYSDRAAAQVVSMRLSEHVFIDNCDMWGCGLNAVFLDECSNVQVTDSVLRDCIYGAVYSLHSTNTVLSNCVISGNAYNSDYRTMPCIRNELKGEWDTLAENESITFNECHFLNNHNPKLIEEGELAEFRNCDFHDNTWDDQTPKSYGICLGGAVWEVNNRNLFLAKTYTFDDGSVLKSTSNSIPRYSEYSLPWKWYDYMPLTADLKLPESLKRIEDEAFAGIKDKVIQLPNGIIYISPTAFDESNTLLDP